MVAHLAGDAVSQHTLQKGNQGRSFALVTIPKDFPQEALKAGSGYLSSLPARGDDRADVVARHAVSERTRAQVKHAFRCAEQPGVGIPAIGGERQSLAGAD